MEECENCNRSHDADFYVYHWYEDTWCLKCNEELPKECAQCGALIEEEDTYCSEYCAGLSYYDNCDLMDEF